MAARTLSVFMDWSPIVRVMLTLHASSVRSKLLVLSGMEPSRNDRDSKTGERPKFSNQKD